MGGGEIPHFCETVALISSEAAWRDHKRAGAHWYRSLCKWPGQAHGTSIQAYATCKWIVELEVAGDNHLPLFHQLI